MIGPAGFMKAPNTGESRRDAKRPVERRVMRIGKPTHLMHEGGNISLCGRSNPEYQTRNKEDVDCLVCLKAVRFKDA